MLSAVHAFFWRVFPAMGVCLLCMGACTLTSCTPKKVPARQAQSTSHPRTPSYSNQFDPGAPLKIFPGQVGSVNGQDLFVQKLQGMYAGYYVPDGRGRMVWVGSEDLLTMPDPALENTREFILQIHELGDQLLAHVQPQGSEGVQSDLVAIPTSFVNVNDFTSTSSLGRYICEQMFYECNQRSIPTLEYRMAPIPVLRNQSGEYALSRDDNTALPVSAATHILTGTYYSGEETVIINARLIEQTTGRIISTAIQALRTTPFLQALLADASQQPLTSVDIPIRDVTLP